MTLIQLINTDNISQCKSVKSVSSVFHIFNNLKQRQHDDMRRWEKGKTRKTRNWPGVVSDLPPPSKKQNLPCSEPTHTM